MNSNIAFVAYLLPLRGLRMLLHTRRIYRIVLIQDVCFNEVIDLVLTGLSASEKCICQFEGV
jgi:hypothetical protein